MFTSSTSLCVFAPLRENSIRGVPSVLIKHNVARRLFLQTGGLAAMGAVAMRDTAWSSQSREMTLFIGTYTSSTSEGIYTYRMNSETGQLTKVGSIKSAN